LQISKPQLNQHPGIDDRILGLVDARQHVAVGAIGFTEPVLSEGHFSLSDKGSDLRV
jgi:hypothetical protein